MYLNTLELPNEPVALGSPFYIERPPIEQQVYQEITKPGCVIRVKAPRKMGKSSLLLRIIDFVKHQNYRTIYLDFQQAEAEVFDSLDKFLRWFCANIAHQLQLSANLEEYWDKELGSKVSCSIYFQDYLLSKLESPLVLALNEVNRIFEYPKIAQDFLALLRSWHEEGKQVDIWQQLRLVICHSTEVYINLNIHQSPFNIGLNIELPEFTTEQIQHLVRLHKLDYQLKMPQIVSMNKMLGGHPYLVRVALYELAKNPKMILDNLLQLAPTINGIYHAHLLNLLVILQNNPALEIALKQVINNASGVEINHILAYKLESMGLVKVSGSLCKISCELYRQYFALQNLEELNLQDKLTQLRKENLELKHLVITDDISQVANRRYFDIRLKELWFNLASEMASLSMILCEIDYLKLYGDANGKQAENNCLQQIASILETCVKACYFSESWSGIIARYDYQQFAMVLPNINSSNACILAEKIRKEVKKLGILHNLAYDGLPARVVTVSLGVACTIPNAQVSTSILVDAAAEALNQSKRNDRNRTYVSSTLNY
ncbi:MAG: AAA-like domain-containing protein [Scytonematopsis contorta HA4267-MV1]|jgi:diguanylate cyclase (GGDEF)-like protein|nr:AAA-like domain-containing protein [Scytonematopsis contorta HA4267-MV1]